MYILQIENLYKKYDKTIEVDVTNFKNAKEGAMEILHFTKEF